MELRIKWSIWCWSLCFMLSGAHAELPTSLRGYLGYQTFVSQNPGQKALLEQFAGMVRDPAVPFSQSQAEPITISVVYPGEQYSDYWRRNITAFEKRLIELNINYEVDIVFTRPNQDLRQQNQMLLNALKSEPDYLIFTLDTTVHRKFIQHVLQDPKIKLILQNITTPVLAWQDHQPLIYLGFDHPTGSRELADYYQSRYPNGADYAVIYFSPGYVSQTRGDTFIRAMTNSASPFRLQTVYYTKADRLSAYRATLAALDEGKPIDIIYACATDVALGVVDALKERNRLHNVAVNGWGGGSAELEAISRGELDVTVMRMNDDTGVAMAEAIKLDMQAMPVPQVYSGEFDIVSLASTQLEIEAFKQRAFRYSRGE